MLGTVATIANSAFERTDLDRQDIWGVLRDAL
jgi:hypothetical protein